MIVSYEALQAIYAWRHSQATTLATGCFSLAGLILSPLLAATFDGDAEIEVWQLVFFAIGATAAAVAGGLWHVRASRVQAEFQAELLPAAGAVTGGGTDEEKEGTVEETLPW